MMKSQTLMTSSFLWTTDEDVFRIDMVKSHDKQDVGESFELCRTIGGGFFSDKTPAIQLRDKEQGLRSRYTWLLIKESFNLTW